MLELEWDQDKRRANIQKHGLDFADARHLDWDNATYLVAFCRRGAKVRIISFRKTNRKEVKRYGK